MSSQTLFDPLNWAASLLMTMNGIFGIVCNGIIVHSFATSPLERTSFNLICAYRAVLNCVILSWGFIGTFVPLTIFGDTLFPPVYHLIVITCVNSLYVGLQYCGFLVAINRFCAMYFPIMYSTLFSLKLTIVFTFAIFCYRISRIVVELLQSIPKKCFSVYSSVDLNWSPYLNPECREKYANVVDATAILLVVLILLNIATFVKIYLFYKSTELGSRDIKEKMKRNKIMFTQTILQDLTYLIDMLFTFRLSGLFTSRVWTFISGSFIWESVHSFDGLIMIMFNERLTFLKRSFFSSTANPSFAIQMTKTVPSRSYPAPID
ncbi:hypothetical protein CRE_26987 [Caenorhabditis remanei]|uniref:7TM GPCR serpentine receptor class x (Srx) domain-containing protein n=1 Tax=Caenorhabditis remanei TaxID=31234 RepID=E3LPM4_CAERE|nr:hypothetical protein CRE_26987 [Caenorhabditis remanei]